jgi:uncharacterized protein (DUF1501 family)
MTRFEMDRLLARRRLLKAGLAGVCTHGAGALGLPLFFGHAADAMAAASTGDNRILVVLELSGGNDGLNTLVPYADDAYYRHRPTIGIKPNKLRKIDDHYGFSGGMTGFERLYKDGKLAVMHGCGYDQPSFSHFTSMAYWHTAAPNSGGEYGWVGRLADSMKPGGAPNFLSTSTRRSRSRCAAASTFRWCSTIPRSLCARASTRSGRCSSSSRTRTTSPAPRSAT